MVSNYPYYEEYIAPSSLHFIHNLVSFREEHSILQLIEDDREYQVRYIKSLVGIAVCLICFWVLWLIVLAALQCGGEEKVGCASGRPFRSWQTSLDKTPQRDRLDYSWNRKKRQKDSGKTRVDDLEGLWRFEQEGSIVDPYEYHEDDDFEDEIFSTYSGVTMQSSWTNKVRSSCCSGSPGKVKRRKVRTRWVYLFTFVILEISGILLFIYLCYPLVNVSTKARSVIDEGYAIHAQIDESVTGIQDTIDIVDRLIKKTPLDTSLICPNVAAFEGTAVIGKDLQTVLGFLATEYSNVLESANADLDVVLSTGDTLGEVLSKSTVVLNGFEARLWILPSIVLSSMVVNWIFGMFFAVSVYSNKTSFPDKPRWKYKTAFLQNRILLPLVIILASLMFFLSVSLLIGGAVASDSCLAGEDQSPDALIEGIIRQQQVAPRQMNEFSVRSLKGYTVEGCQGEDPVEDIQALQQQIQEVTRLMHQWIQQTYQSGLPRIADDCGEGNRVLDFFDGVFLLHAEFWNIQEYLKDLEEALSCPTIHRLYIDTTHDIACYQLSGAITIGCVLMMLHATTSLVLFSLRASWR